MTGHRSRYLTLDGARGVAAVLVVWFHVAKVYAVPAPPAAYLAVDMFFALSGFVIARTYDPRFAAGLTARQFLWGRAVRLYPLYFAGLVLGLVQLALMVKAGLIPMRTLIGSAVAGAVALPAWVPFQPHRLFPAIGPAWSLFCEFWVANLGFALLWRYITLRRLAVVMAVSALGLLYIAFKHHGIDQGSTWRTLPAGITRVVFSFTAGVALWRYFDQHRPRVQVPSIVILVTIAALLCMPPLGRAQFAYDCLCVFILFPALIYFGAEARERRPELGRLAGELSYALYILHAPLLMLFVMWVPGRDGNAFLIGLLFTLGALVIAAVANRMDETIRRRRTLRKVSAAR